MDIFVCFIVEICVVNFIMILFENFLLDLFEVIFIFNCYFVFVFNSFNKILNIFLRYCIDWLERYIGEYLSVCC